jgi:hypothetical protein
MQLESPLATLDPNQAKNGAHTGSGRSGTIRSLSTKPDLSGIFGVPGHENLVNMAFLHFESVHNRFLASNYPNRVIFTKKFFPKWLQNASPFKARVECISATRKSYSMILVSFDCYEIQFSNDTETIRIGLVFPEKSE